MKYGEALKKVEQWLDKRDIRHFCRTVCKGKCCKKYCGSNRCDRPPLSCATYICPDLRIFLFGFHNGEQYHKLHLEITGIIFNAGHKPNNPMIVDDGIIIPDKLIDDLITTKYEEDIHDWGK